MKRKALTFAAIVSGVTLAVTGCSTGTSSSPTASDEKTTISVAVWSLDTTPEFGALISAFEEANPNITVQPVDILGTDYITKVTTMLAGGDTTDVIGMKSVAQYSQAAGTGQLVDLTKTVDSLADRKDITGLSTYKTDGKYFAIPYRWDSWVLYYNKDLFDAAGQPYPTKLTWKQYDALAKKLVSGTDANKVWGTYQVPWNSLVQNIAAVQTDSDLLGGDNEFMTDQYNLTLDLQDSGAMMDWSTASTTKASYNALFNSSQTAMLPIGTWMTSSILAGQADGTATVKNWGIAPIPQVPGAKEVTTMGTSTGFGINKNSKNVEAAKKFVEFTASADGAKALAKVGVSPALKNDAVISTLFGLKGMPTDEGSQAAYSPQKAVLDTPQSPNTAKIAQILTDEHQLIMTGQKSVKDGIQEMDDRIKNEVLNQ